MVLGGRSWNLQGRQSLLLLLPWRHALFLETRLLYHRRHWITSWIVIVGVILLHILPRVHDVWRRLLHFCIGTIRNHTVLLIASGLHESLRGRGRSSGRHAQTMLIGHSRLRLRGLRLIKVRVLMPMPLIHGFISTAGIRRLLLLLATT